MRKKNEPKKRENVKGKKLMKENKEKKKTKC